MAETDFRLAALNLAHECLAQAYYSARDNKREKWHNQPEGAEPTAFPSLGKYPTPDDVIAAAEKFKTFLTT